MLQSLTDFFRFVRQAELRFYQERDLGLDLYHNGFPGVVLAFLAAATVVVFFLAIFHVIPRKKHVVWLLLGLGGAALLLGLVTSLAHYGNLAAIEPSLIRPTAGPPPVSDGQRAAVVSLPFLVGILTSLGAVIGCLYMAIFWGAGAAAVTTKKPRGSPS
jgi:putative exporter of polyketide antibiotics